MLVATEARCRALAARLSGRGGRTVIAPAQRPPRLAAVLAEVQAVAGGLVADPELVAGRLLAGDDLRFDAADPDRPLNTREALRRLLGCDPKLIR